MYFIGALIIPALWVISACTILWIAFVDAVKNQWILGLVTILSFVAWFIPFRVWQWTITPLAILALLAVAIYGRKWLLAAIIGLISVILLLGFAFRSEPQNFLLLNRAAILLWNCGPLMLAFSIRELLFLSGQFSKSKMSAH